MIVLELKGENVYELFKQETGGHRWQRIPPTEKRGRRQTSSITIAVFRVSKEDKELKIDKRDLKIEYSKGSGPGGQHRNKTETAVRIRHNPSGICVYCCSGRSQRDNENKAIREIIERIRARRKSKRIHETAAVRQSQIGRGYRGNKIRTIQEQNDLVINHLNNKKMSYKRYKKGFVEEIH